MLPYTSTVAAYLYFSIEKGLVNGNDLTIDQLDLAMAWEAGVNDAIKGESMEEKAKAKLSELKAFAM